MADKRRACETGGGKNGLGDGGSSSLVTSQSTGQTINVRPGSPGALLIRDLVYMTIPKKRFKKIKN